MANNPYQDAFESAVTELSNLYTRRDAVQKEVDTLDERIDKVRQGALGLAALVDLDFGEIKRDYPRLFSDEHDPKLGITEAIRLALQDSLDSPLLPIEIKERVLQLSPAVAGHKNPMASIHAVLRRLVDAGEVVMADYEGSGQTVFGWIGTDTDKAEIKRRLKRWFSNGQWVWERESDRWKDRPDGLETEETEDGGSVDSAVLRKIERATPRKKPKRSLKN